MNTKLLFAPLIGGLVSAGVSGGTGGGYTRDFPPSWVFGPVWTVLYLMMGYASSIVYQRTGSVPVIFWIQLAMNLAWSPIYFGQKNIKLAKTLIYALWVSILFTIVEFWNIDAFAAKLLIPYLAWVSYASTLF
jgi:tryptophan-rich sensory protein